MNGLNGVVDRNSGVNLFAGDPLVLQIKAGSVSLQQWMRSLFLLFLLAFLLSPLFITQALAATLTVQLPGSGHGNINSVPSGITCPGTCSYDFSSVTLYANPSDDSIFSGWGGACAGMETCALSLSGATTVTALFTLKTSPLHVSGSYYGALQKAYDTVAAGGVVMAVAQDQPGDFTLNRGISHTLKGGYDAGFSSNAGNFTRVNGTVSLATGSMTVENIAIGQSVASPTAAPANVVATPGNQQVSLSWDTVPGATSYNIYYSTTTGVTRGSGPPVTGTSVVTGLTNGATYYFVVTAVSANGESVESNQVIATPIQSAPAAPTGVLATSGNGQATVSWDAVSGATSYNIYYSTSSAVSKATGTKITNAVSPRAVTGLTNTTTYWFVVTAVNAGGESADSAPAVHATPLAPATGFSQADLTGTWNFIRFAAGPDVNSGSEPGWMRGNANVAADGTVTVNSILDNLGHTTPPPVGTLSFSINSEGIVTQSGASALDPGNHGVMAANKKIVVGNGSNGTTTRVILIFVKQDGTSFSNSDLTSKAFVYHELYSGPDNGWGYGDGSVDSLNRVTINHSYSPSGTETPPPANFTTLSLTSTGIMSATDNLTSQGVMTPDKRTAFVTETNTGGNGHYTLRIIQMTGQTYTQADMAGTWRIHELASSSSAPVWEYDLDSVTSAGLVAHVATIDSTGNTVPSSNMPTMTLGTTGVITRSDRPAKHGQLSYNKDMAVMTDTKNGLYSLAIGLKQ